MSYNYNLKLYIDIVNENKIRMIINKLYFFLFIFYMIYSVNG